MRPVSSRFSRPVAVGSAPLRCATTPMTRRTCGGLAPHLEAGHGRASPESAWASVVRILTVVDLPAPFGPSRPKTVPAGTAKLSPSRARMPLG